ncbi:MAG: UMP kinase [Candidatus Cloacimonetes bacterium 4572_55]|nr:MAG: UMP kinase [Candidatus Cloacimonetes bacterium 4572_55]
MQFAQYERILIKMSGEVLAGKAGFGIDLETVSILAAEIKDIRSLQFQVKDENTGEVVETKSVQIGIVLGGGNLFRGASLSGKKGVTRATADYMGMLATAINGLALRDVLESHGTPARVMSAIQMRDVAETYIREKALRHMGKNRVVIMVGGTGSPYFTTDTAAALRAIELDVKLLLKGTKVDGIYSGDPMVDTDAVFFPRIAYKQVLKERLKIMDGAAFALCEENDVVIKIFNIRKRDLMRQAIIGEPVGTLVTKEEKL